MLSFWSEPSGTRTRDPVIKSQIMGLTLTMCNKKKQEFRGFFLFGMSLIANCCSSTATEPPQTRCFCPCSRIESARLRMAAVGRMPMRDAWQHPLTSVVY